MNPDFLHSALHLGDQDASRPSLREWFAQRQAAHRFHLEQIPFRMLQKWIFDEGTGNLVHASGKFFSIEGIHVRTSWGIVPEWQQPIINQPEIGILGFLTKKISGVLHFLVQAKMEPGNINMIQLAPTLQATRSNFTQVHQGRKPPYLDYFLNQRNPSSVLVDVLQSEQGARFLRKRNRNIIIETEEEVPLLADYRWMTLGELLRAMRQNNLVNMDARTVLSCIPYAVDGQKDLSNVTGIDPRLIRSFSHNTQPLHSNEDIISWFTEQKFRHELDVRQMPLRDVQHWIKTDMDIRHETGRYFSVIACAVEADNREVSSWTQPLIKAHQQGLIAFLVKEIKGTWHFLIQAKVEPGNFDIVEMAPTVQCLTGNYAEAPAEARPPFISDILNAPPDRILFDTLQSEEGGRFYREENRNLIVLAGDDFPREVPDSFVWMTASQLKDFTQYNNFINVQCRCLLSSLNLITEEM